MKRKPWPCIDCRVMMAVIDDDHCKCHNCGTEVWYEYGEPSERKQIDDAVENNHGYVSRSLPERLKVPGGGSKAGKRAGKERMRNKSTQTIYEQMFKQT